MLYGKGLPEEERLHQQFHNAHALAFRFQGWASERVVLRDGARSRLLVVLPGDPTAQLRKVNEVCSRLEKVLGVPDGYLLAPNPPYKVFLWVTTEPGGGGGAAAGQRGAAGSGSSNASGGGGGGGKGRIAGVLVAQLQRKARRCRLPPPVTQCPSQQQPLQQRLWRQREQWRGQVGGEHPGAGAAGAPTMPGAASTGPGAIAAAEDPLPGAAVASVAVTQQGLCELDSDSQPLCGSVPPQEVLGREWEQAPPETAARERPDHVGAGSGARGGKVGCPPLAEAPARATARDAGSGGSGGGGTTGCCGEAGGEVGDRPAKRVCRAGSSSQEQREAHDGGPDEEGGGRQQRSLEAARAAAGPGGAGTQPGAPVMAGPGGGGGGAASVRQGATPPSSATAAAPAAPALAAEGAPGRASQAAAGVAAHAGRGATGMGAAETAVRVVLGVRGVWVEPGSRRRGVARRMLDAARCCMVPGYPVGRDQVAFSACAVAATGGEDDGGAAFTALAASYSGGGGSPEAEAAWMVLYDDEDDGDLELRGRS